MGTVSCDSIGTHSNDVVSILDDSSSPASPTKDGKRRLKPGKKREDDDSGDSRNARKTSLKLGSTGKKGRAANLSSRRGSLRKRDRSAEKEAKAVAAEERRTVYLPE